MGRHEIDPKVMELARLKYVGGMKLADVLNEPGIKGEVSLSKLKKACADGGWSAERDKRAVDLMNLVQEKRTVQTRGGAQIEIMEEIAREEVRHAQDVKRSLMRIMDQASELMEVQIPRSRELMNRVIELGASDPMMVMDALKMNVVVMDTMRKVVEGVAKFDPRMDAEVGVDAEAEAKRARAEEVARDRMNEMNFGEYA